MKRTAIVFPDSANPIAMSDLHLGIKHLDDCDYRKLRNFLHNHRKRKTKKNPLLLIGDIFELYLFRQKDIMSSYREFLEYLVRNFNPIIIKGNHDNDLDASPLREIGFKVIETPMLQIHYRGENYLVTHGNKWDFISIVVPIIGSIISRTISGLGIGFGKDIRKPYRQFFGLGRYGVSQRYIKKAIKLSIKKNAKVIFGHTHQPNKIKNIINTGCWVKRDKGKYGAYFFKHDRLEVI